MDLRLAVAADEGAHLEGLAVLVVGRADDPQCRLAGVLAEQLGLAPIEVDGLIDGVETRRQDSRSYRGLVWA